MKSLQTMIHLSCHSPFIRSLQFLRHVNNYARQKYGRIIPFEFTFRREYSDEAIDYFLEGQQASLALQWRPKNFRPSEREKQYNLAVEHLRSVMEIKSEKKCSVMNASLKPIISKALTSKDLSIVEDKLEWCLSSGNYPSFAILKALAGVSVESQNSQCFSTIRNVVKVGHPEKYLQHAKLLLHAAEVSWRIGNFADFEIFLLKVFKDFPFAEAQARLLFSQKVAEAVQCEITPALTILEELAENLLVNEKDYFPMTVTWYYLFASNKPVYIETAESLVRKNEGLKIRLSYLVETMALKLLKANQVQQVLRLLEFLLEHKFYQQYSGVQQLLFKYHYFRGDVNACAAILKASIKEKQPLSEDLRDLYMKMMMEADENNFKKTAPPVELKF